MRFAPYRCPECDQLAAGTVEVVQGIALVTFDDEGDAEYTGETKIDWNSQVTVRDALGRITLECPEGHQWPAVTADMPEWKQRLGDT